MNSADIDASRWLGFQKAISGLHSPLGVSSDGRSGIIAIFVTSEETALYKVSRLTANYLVFADRGNAALTEVLLLHQDRRLISEKFTARG